uniref:Uncharacterized protein n=1 Tax=Cacopsylla melanoneura TaxID=428564 RepID=A0A8D8SNI3_9HEMI
MQWFYLFSFFFFFFAMQITTQSYLLPFSFVCTYSYGRVVRVRQKISYHIDSHLLNTNFPFVFFFFKQKPAYDLTYGDWSSYVVLFRSPSLMNGNCRLISF